MLSTYKLLLVLLTTAILLFSGCSTLDKVTYYSIVNSEYDHFIHAYPDDERRIALDGESDQHINLYHNEAMEQTVNFVSFTHKWSGISRGPIIIPIIPTFGFPKLRIPKESNTVLVAFHTTGGAKVNYDIDSFRLIEADGKEFSVLDSYDHWNHNNMKCFTFNFSDEFCDSFAIDFGDISINDEVPFRFTVDFEVHDKFYYFQGFFPSW